MDEYKQWNCYCSIFCFLSFSWTTLVYKNFEIEKECLKLLKEIDYLQSQTTAMINGKNSQCVVLMVSQ